MIKVLVFLSIILFSQLSSKVADIEEKISKTSSEIKGFDSKQDTLTQNMNKTAKEILKQEQIIKQQQEELKSLSDELSKKSEVYKDSIASLNTLQKEQIELNKEQEELKKKLIDTISQNISLGKFSASDKFIDYNSVISSEVLKSLQKLNDKKIKLLQEDYNKKSSKIDSLDKQSKNLKDSISTIEKKRYKLKRLKSENLISLKNLKLDKEKYKLSLDEIIKQRISLKQTLAKLNIIKEEEREKESNKVILSSKDLPSVKRIGSSYQKNVTKKYTGKKTIAPLDDYSVIKKFGTYTDPVYGIKIFNESVVLKPKVPKSKVKNVLNGKVILAKYTSLLDNVVIVEHDNKMHTIYAHLDQIAPNIEKGKKVKKGHILGRVNDELMFEVTQKNFHINPLELIN